MNFKYCEYYYAYNRTCLLLTPIFSLFSHQIVYKFNFFFVVFGSLIVWRLFYVRFLASNRFMQTIFLFVKIEVEELISGIENIDPHYKIIGMLA
jgi:hypothetical protein